MVAIDFAVILLAIDKRRKVLDCLHAYIIVVFCLETKVSSSLFLSQALSHRSYHLGLKVVAQPLANFLSSSAPQLILLRPINHATIHTLVVMLNNGEDAKVVKLKRDIVTLAAKLHDEIDYAVHAYIILVFCS